MSNNDLKDNIVRLLEEVAERAGYINHRHPEKQDLSLDIDLVKDDLRRLYRQFELLKNANGEKSAPEKAENKADESGALSDEPPASEKPAVSRPAGLPQEESGQGEAERPSGRPVTHASRPDSPGSGNNKAVIDLLSEYAGRTIGDQYLEEDNSVHQHISNQKEDKSIGARMQQKPIASLKEAIGVNEKFLFINELFKGNIQAYNEAISRLNEMDDAKAAFDYLNELSMIHSWDANRSVSTIEKLADLVHRRHMSK